MKKKQTVSRIINVLETTSVSRFATAFPHFPPASSSIFKHKKHGIAIMLKNKLKCA
jgi:hypothetical protein